MRSFRQQHMLHEAMVQPRMATRIGLPAAVLLLRQCTLGQHLAQHTAQAVFAARPLHCAGISQIFTLARHRRLEQLATQPAHKASGLNKSTKPLRKNAVAFTQALAKVVNQLQP